MIRLIALLAALVSAPAFAWPENTRHGYDSCAACHVAETGGGTLTPYGREAGSSFLASWTPDKFEQPLYGLAELPDWLMVGGDLRSVYFASSPPMQRQYVRMEQSFELAVQPPNNPGLTLDAEVGRYGQEGRLQYRRLFAKVDLTQNVGVRVGHFIPSYGINVDDHTTATRSALGLGEGQESWNAEAYWLAPRGEVELTGIAGTDTTVDLNSRRPGDYQTDSATGWALRAAAYVGDATSVGISAMDVSTFEALDVCGGVFVQTGLGEKGVLLAEIDRADEANVYSTVSLVRGGYELVSGLMGTLQLQTLNLAPELRAGLQWIPVPHFEFRGELRRSWPAPGAGGAPQNTALALMHHWL